ncbi:MAG TPA: hypothetical protein PLH91_10720 [Tenuifilaceae bacterium]|nr:hypothetical protein [Tenuifilaceae bacterium]HPI45695.1 hypothetical protein [Tenuifilaceae bacterium]HPN21935.1 hypothetical protein [Tenuifilaceae bacterium]HPV56647.1 hypothetical protein [Tenuifilaceae bacterium]
MKPIFWIGKKYLEEQIQQETKELKDKVYVLEKNNISLNHCVSDHKERIAKLEERIREFEIKITAVETAFSVVGMLNGKSNSFSLPLDNERRSING